MSLSQGLMAQERADYAHFISVPLLSMATNLQCNFAKSILIGPSIGCGTVASELEKQKNEALALKKDFAFETNFSNEMVVEMVREFKKAGFKVSLYYFGLYSEDESVSRVIHRVQTGGHNVTDEVIRFNFNEGLKNTKQHLHLFENLAFIDGSSDFGKIVALHIERNHVHEVAENPPLWFREQFENVFDNL